MKFLKKQEPCSANQHKGYWQGIFPLLKLR